LRRSGLLLAAAAVLAGCAGSHRAAPNVASVKIEGGTPLEQRLMRQVVRGFGPRAITSVAISQSLPGPAIDVSMAHDPTAARHVRFGWEDWIVSAAFARRLVGRGLHPTLTLTEPDSGDQIYPRREHNPDPKPATAAQARAVVDTFRRASLRAGARVLEASAGKPYGLAPRVTLSVADPARFLKDKLWHLLQVYDERRNEYEGYYLGILDSHGGTVLEAGNSTRVQGGSYWVRPDLDSCSPIVHGGTPLQPQPPPCPA